MHAYEAKSPVKITWLLVVLVGVVENLLVANPLKKIKKFYSNKLTVSYLPCPLIYTIVPPFKLAWFKNCQFPLPCIVVTSETTAGFGTMKFSKVNFIVNWAK